jgi:hypothetical protein
MTTYANDDLRDALKRVDACLNGTASVATLHKAVTHLADQVTDLEQHVQDRDQKQETVGWMHKKQMAALWQKLQEMDASSVPRAEIIKLFNKYWDDTHDMREKAASDYRKVSAKNEEEPDDLTKAVAAYLQPGDTLEKAGRVTMFVVRQFGRNGGQLVRYDKQLASELLLSKSISRDEHQCWREFGRLPDSVSLTGGSAGRAQAEIDRAMQVSQALAAMNISPLALQHYLNRR